MRISKNHNSLGCEQPLGLDVNQSPVAPDAFRPMPGLISCAGATGSVGVTCHAHATQMAGLKYPLEPTAAGSTRLLQLHHHNSERLLPTRWQGNVNKHKPAWRVTAPLTTTMLRRTLRPRETQTPRIPKSHVKHIHVYTCTHTHIYVQQKTTNNCYEAKLRTSDKACLICMHMLARCM